MVANHMRSGDNMRAHTNGAARRAAAAFAIWAVSATAAQAGTDVTIAPGVAPPTQRVNVSLGRLAWQAKRWRGRPASRRQRGRLRGGWPGASPAARLAIAGHLTASASHVLNRCRSDYYSAMAGEPLFPQNCGSGLLAKPVEGNGGLRW